MDNHGFNTEMDERTGFKAAFEGMQAEMEAKGVEDTAQMLEPDWSTLENIGPGLFRVISKKGRE